MGEKRYYMACLDLEGRDVLVVGAGSVALEKINGLLYVGARVTVVAPEVSAQVDDLARAGRLALVCREYRSSDLREHSGEFRGHVLRVSGTLAWAERVPLGPRGEISFLLDRNKVAVTQERVHVDRAMYRGEDNQGRPFQLTAGSAIQPSPASPILDLKDLLARMQLKDGPAELKAPGGAYNFDTSKVMIPGPVQFDATGGYTMVTQNVGIDFKTNLIIAGGLTIGLAIVFGLLLMGVQRAMTPWRRARPA